MRPHILLPGDGDKVFAQEEYICRVGMLLGNTDLWWNVESEDTPEIIYDSNRSENFIVITTKFGPTIRLLSCARTMNLILLSP